MQSAVRVNADFTQIITQRVVQKYKRKLRLATKTALNAAQRHAKAQLIATAAASMNAPLTKRDISADYKATHARLRAIFALHYDRRKLNIGRVSGAAKSPRGVRFASGGVTRVRKKAFIVKKLDGRVFKRVGNHRNRLSPQGVRIRIAQRKLKQAYDVSFVAFWANLRRSLARIEKTYGSGGKFTAGQKAAFGRLSAQRVG